MSHNSRLGIFQGVTLNNRYQRIEKLPRLRSNYKASATKDSFRWDWPTLESWRNRKFWILCNSRLTLKPVLFFSLWQPAAVLRSSSTAIWSKRSSRLFARPTRPPSSSCQATSKIFKMIGTSFLSTLRPTIAFTGKILARRLCPNLTNQTKRQHVRHPQCPNVDRSRYRLNLGLTRDFVPAQPPQKKSFRFNRQILRLNPA